MIRVKKSKHVSSIEEYIEKVLPKYMNEIYFAYCKKDAVNFIKKFQKNLRDNKFNVKPLNPKTVEGKREKGHSRPDTPLYGAGDSEKNSYYNMFLLRKLGKGYEAYPRWAKHHEGDIALRDLLKVHEYGATIIVTERMRNFLHTIGIHLRKDTWLIRIPPRPVAFMTYRQVLQERKKETRSQRVKRALNIAINTGNESTLKKIKEQELLLSNQFKVTEV